MLAGDRLSYIAGVCCGLLLLALFAIALVLAIAPMVRDRDRRFAIALTIAGAITLVKLALLPYLPGVTIDLVQFETWAYAMAQYGPAHIYDPEFICKYTPAYLYALWPAAALAPRFESLRVFIESPAIIADFLLAVTVYAAASMAGRFRFALPASLLVILNPTLIYTSTFWGQNDSAIAFPVLLSLVMALQSQYALAWAIAIVAALIKAQGLMLLPILAWWTLINARFTDWLKAAAGAFLAAIVVIVPFQIGHQWRFIFDVYAISFGFFPWASVNAFNLMLVLGGLIRLDNHRLFGPISYFVLGNVLFGAAYVIAAWIALRRRDAWGLLFSMFIVYLGMYVFAPRMHERYLYYAVALLAPVMFRSRTLLALYVVLSVTLLLDMAYVWLDLIYVRGFVEGRLLLGNGGKLAISIINVAAFGIAAGYGLRAASRAELPTSIETDLT